MSAMKGANAEMNNANAVRIAIIGGKLHTLLYLCQPLGMEPIAHYSL